MFHLISLLVPLIALGLLGLVALAPQPAIAQVPNSPTPTRTPTPINIGNFVWDDRDHDGLQDAGEPGLSGITVQLWNSAKNDLIDSAVTNANGNYTLVAPTPGNYRVRVLLPNPSLDEFSPKNAGDDLKDSDINPSGTNFGFTDIISIASNVISTTKYDAGIMVYRTPTPTRTPTPINVGNFVWSDLDGDGIQDAGEPGLPGITVQLWNSAKNDLIDSKVTNANGNYTLIAPTPGNYRVRVLLPGGGSSFSPKNIGSDGADSDINPSGTDLGFTDIYVFASNLISITTIDAGILNAPPPPPATPTRTATRTATPTRTPTRTPTQTISAQCASPAAPALSKPKHKANITKKRPRLVWGAVNCAQTYNVTVYLKKVGGTVVQQVTGVTATNFKTKSLQANKKYAWVVQACSAYACGSWSAGRKFSVLP